MSLERWFFLGLGVAGLAMLAYARWGKRFRKRPNPEVKR